MEIKVSRPISVTVVGAGSWGTALANHLARSGRLVTLWGNSPQVLEQIRSERANPQFFPGEPLESRILVEADLGRALEKATLIVLAIPSYAVRSIMRQAVPHIPKGARIVSGAKGLEQGTLKRLSEVIAEEYGRPELVAVLSGPSFALEVLRGQATAVTVASNSSDTAKAVAEAFHAGLFRVYTSSDVAGVEIGGAFKNVIALAVGIADGLGLGLNARAALITRGIAEIGRMIEATGGDSRTATGLSGLGDLVLTSTGDLSRNRQVGIRLGKGERLSDILLSLGQVAEGVEVAPKMVELAARKKIELPISYEVNRVLKGESSPGDSLKALMSREMRSEYGD